MPELLIKATKRTPFVVVDFTAGLIELRGNSIPENPSEFFIRIDKALNEYVKAPAPKTTANISLNIFNTSTSKWLLYLLLRLKELAKPEKQEVIINWYYEKGDDDSLEAGKGFMTLMRFPINLLEMEE
jgi:hypothetical protein